MEGKIVYEFKNKKPKPITIDGKMRKWFEQEHNCECLANLYEANLTEANLTKANLTDANLNRANLKDANLTSANLSGAKMS